MSRSTVDQRLIIGGEDDAIDIPLKRDASVSAKSETLRRKFSARFPALELDIAFAWAGTFAETGDGLPYFGPHDQYGPRVHFAMAYGGNGITYSAIGARILRDALAGERHPCAGCSRSTEGARDVGTCGRDTDDRRSWHEARLAGLVHVTDEIPASAADARARDSAIATPTAAR